MNAFLQKIASDHDTELRAAEVRTLQANLGLRCNLSCRHCHVGGSPERAEVMEWPVMESLLRLAAAFPTARVDLTGGAPELNPNFTRLVAALRETGHPVQVRTNLTVLMEAGYETYPAFYRDHQVQLVASLPCYLDENVRAQRGPGVHAASIAAIRKLNALGYGRDPDFPLDLVYNPGGPFLPPGQQALEEAYRRELGRDHGIEFSRLLTITNMPIARFGYPTRVIDPPTWPAARDGGVCTWSVYKDPSLVPATAYEAVGHVKPDAAGTRDDGE